MKFELAFRPMLLNTLKGYSRQEFLRDLVAGITVGVVALPLAMAFGIASGVKPEAGIFTAVIAGFIISAFGGSRVQIGGPTGAFVVIVYEIIAEHGLPNLLICTVMAGVILLIMGFSKMGTMIKYIPYPVTMGFTCGIAVLIFSTQIKDFTGLGVDRMPSDFLEKIAIFVGNIQSVHWPTLLLAASCVALIVLWPKRLSRHLPGSMAALILGTGLVWIFNIPVDTIGSRYNGIPQQLPSLLVPTITWNALKHLIQPAVTIALLAAIESLLSAVVADGMIDDRHDSNQELVAQGLANIVTPLFGGIPATGAIARTATNVRTGGRTPVAGMIHALTLFGIILVAAPVAKYIPLASLSAVLVVVAYNMGEWEHFKRLRKWPKSDASVFLTAFGLTVLVDLTVAVEVGMVLASALFIKRISETTQITGMNDGPETDGATNSMEGRVVPEGVLIYKVFGAFFFGAADKLESALKRAHREPEILILRMDKVVAMDATGLNALEDLHEKLKAKGRTLILSGPHTQPYMTMDKAGFLDSVGAENVCGHLEASLARASEILAARRLRNPSPPSAAGR